MKMFAKRKQIKLSTKQLQSCVYDKYGSSLCYQELLSDNVKWLEITRTKCDLSVNMGGPAKASKILVSEGGDLTMFALGQKILTRSYNESNEIKDAVIEFCKKLDSSYRHCIGITTELWNEAMQDKFNGTSQCIKENHPFLAYRSNKCERWFSRSKITTKPSNLPGSCLNCTNAFKRLKQLQQPTAKIEHLNPKSHCNLRYLPKTKQKARIQRKKRAYTSKLYQEYRKKLRPLEVQLTQTQNNELLEVATKIVNDQKALTEFLKHSAKEHGSEFSNLLRDLMMLDQRRNKPNATGNRWNLVTYRVCYSIVTRSPAAYEALRNEGIFNLPSRRQLKRKIAEQYKQTPGLDEKYLADQRKKYNEEALKSNTAGLALGVLVGDEVKIIAKICWNQNNNEIQGVASDSEDLCSMGDIFNLVAGGDSAKRASSKPTEYAFQTVYRDLTSNYDILGPYHFYSGAVKAAQVYECMDRAMQGFEAYGFHIAALILDGAPCNLAVFKKLSRSTSKDFREGGRDVPHSFQNPYNPSLTVSLIPCPSHGLKSMISALFQSRTDGPRTLQLQENTSPFGWEVLEAQYEREIERKKAHRMRKVPGLRKDYIERNAWTRLNVAPSKIFQQPKCIAELKAEIERGNDSENKSTIMSATAYLVACNLLFEQGFLSHTPIKNAGSQPLINISKGLKFFTDWKARIDSSSNLKTKNFIAWQTYDLLRMAVCGFETLALTFEQYCSSNDCYFIIPHKVNGSAVETVFSQIRRKVTCGKVTARDYPVAIAHIRMEKDMPRTSLHTAASKRKKMDSDYRDTEMHLK